MSSRTLRKRKPAEREASKAGGVSKSKKAKVTESKTPSNLVAVPASTMVKNVRLQREFFNQSCEKLAQALLGKLLVRIDDDGTRMTGVVVEAEAYLGVTDPSCHTYGNKKTDRNAAMYEQPGTSYVYFSYGMHFCANVVSSGNGAAVLIRALEPCEGLHAMRVKRERVRLAKPSGKKNSAREQMSADALESVYKATALCNGPAKLCESLGISRNSHDKVDMCTSATYFFEETALEEFQIATSARIGISGPSASWPLRFYIQGNRCVSKP